MPQIQKNLMGSGLVAEAAKSIAGRVVTGLTAAGSSSQANSLGVYAEINVVTTTAANTGVRLPSNAAAGDSMLVVNLGGSTLFIYPPSGGKINAGSTDAKVDAATLKSALCTSINGLDWSVLVGA